RGCCDEDTGGPGRVLVRVREQVLASALESRSVEALTALRTLRCPSIVLGHMRRVVWPLAVLGIGASVALYACAGTLSVALLRRVAARTIFAGTGAGLPEGLHVALCGTGSPYPDPTRAGPCAGIIAGQHVFIVDSGRGSPDVVARMGLQGSRIEAVLLTHFHSDHIDGLPQLAEQRWVAWRAKTPVLVIGPPGVDRVVAGFNEAHALNDIYRTAHHGADAANPAGAGMTARPFALPEPPGSVVVFEGDGLRIT